MTSARIINHHGNVEEVSAPAFTPGPWVVAFDDESGGVPVLVIETDQPVGPHLQTVCHVQPRFIEASDEFVLNDEVHENARLIAAAPELYEALEFLLGQFDQAHVANLVERSPSAQAAIVQAKAALAKARGEQ